MAYSNAIFFIDYATVGLGDAIRPTLSSVIFSNPSDNIVLGTKVSHGLVTGAVVTVSGCTQAYANSTWKITLVDNNTFTLDNALWTSFTGTDVTGDVVPFGGSSWTDAWVTITNGATASRIAPGDIIRIAKSPDNTSLGIDGTWNNIPLVLPVSKNIGSSTNTTPIKITINNHGFSTGDVLFVQNHTINLTANGDWRITVVDTNNFTLDDSTPTAVGGATGNCTKINHQVVQLSSALTTTISRCETLWTSVNAATVTLDTSVYRSGDASVKIVKSSPVNSTLYARTATGTLDLSGYQKISFSICNYTAILSNQWKICLCSNTDGTGIIDTFKIPAIPSTGAWVPLTLTGTNINLGNNIASVALYSDTSAATTTGVFLDNIVACTESGLNLQSLISKNSSLQGGTEAFYGIRSISHNGKILRLEARHGGNPDTSLLLRGPGYYGTSETVPLYKRETIKTVLASSNTTVVSNILDSGDIGNPIVFDGGFDTSDVNLRNGETFFDGLSGLGYGINVSNIHYVTINNLNVVRYYDGVYVINGSYLTINNMTNCNHCNDVGIHNRAHHTIINNINNINYNGTGVYSAGNGYDLTVNNIDNIIGSSSNGFNSLSYNITILRIGNIINGGSHGMNFTGSYNNRITEITNVNYNGSSGVYVNDGSCNMIFSSISNIIGNPTTGIYLVEAFDIRFCSVSSMVSNGYGIYFLSANNCYVSDATISGSTTASVYSSKGLNYLNKTTLSDSVKFYGALSNSETRVYSQSQDGSNTTNMTYTDGALVTSVPTDRVGGTGLMWKLDITSSSRDSKYPMYFPVAKIAVTENNAVTVKAFLKKSHATNIVGKLMCNKNQLSGITTDVITVKSDDTDWEELTLPDMTPTENGIIEIGIQAEYVSGSASLYVEDLTITQV